MIVSPNKRLLPLFFDLFDKGIFNYEDLKRYDKQKLYVSYLKDTSLSDKLNYLSSIGNDETIERINDSILTSMNTDNPDDFCYCAASIMIGLSESLDDIIVDHFNAALVEWNLYNNENNRPRITERELAIHFDNKSRRCGGF